MHLSRIAPLIALIAACGGKDPDSGGPSTPACEPDTTPISALTPDQYPEGLASGIEALQNLQGLWEAEHCFEAGHKIRIKINGMPGIPDDIEVVNTPGVPDALCGCSADLTYAKDNALDQVALVPGFDMTFDINEVLPEDAIDPGLDDRTFTVTGSLFGGDNGLLFRACTDELIEPYLNSEYDTVVVNLRIQTATETTPLSHLGDVTLEAQLIKQQQGAQPYVCDLTGFQKIN